MSYKYPYERHFLPVEIISWTRRSQFLRRGAARVSIFGIVKRFLRKPLHLNVLKKNIQSLPALSSRYWGALNFSHKEMMIHMIPREQVKQM